MHRTVYLVLGLLAACSNEAPDAMENKPVDTAQLKEQKKHYPTVEVSGTVVWKTFEGGFWGFDGDNGQKYMPQNLPKEYRQDGTRLKVSGLVITDMMTFQQYGQSMKIKDVVLLEKSNKLRPDEF